MRPDHEQALRALADALAGRGRPERTRYLFDRTARAFFKLTDKPVAEITRDDVRAYLAKRSKKIAAVSQSAELVHLRALFKAALEAKLTKTNPTIAINVNVPEKAQPFLSKPTVTAMLKAPFVAPKHKRMPADLEHALALRTRAVLELLYGTGVRAVEAGRILVTDVSLRDRTVVVRPAKRGQPRTLPLPWKSAKHLENYLFEGRPKLVRLDGRDKGALLLSRYGKPLGPKGVGVAVKLAAKKGGLSARPHDFRRSIATDMVRAGVNLEAVRKVLGQSALETTAIYLDVNRDDLRKAVEKLETDAKA